MTPTIEDYLDILRDSCIDEEAYQRVLGVMLATNSRNTHDLSEEILRYRAIIELMAEGALLYDENGLPIIWNSSAERILGLTTDQLRGRTSVSSEWYTVHEDGSSFGSEDYPVNVTLRTGEIVRNVIMGVHRPDGELRWLSISSMPIFRDNSDKPYQTVASFADITQIKNADQALRHSEKRYHDIVNSQLDPICRYHPDTTLTFVNEAYKRFFGKEGEDLIGRSFLDFIPPEEHEGILRKIEATLKSRNHVVYEHSVITAAGKIRWMQWTESVIDHTAGEISIQSTGRDITERKQMEMALRESEQAFRQIAENVEHFFFIRDLVEYRVIYASPAYERIWGRPVENFYADPRDFMTLVHPDDLERVADTFQIISQGQQANIEYRLLMPDDEIRWIWMRVFPIHDDTRKAIRAVGIVEDITQRKAIEHQRVNLAIEREQRRVLSNFIRDASHEFRTPLSTINTSLHLAVNVKDPARRDEHVRKALDHVDNITELVDVLLLMSGLDGDAAFDFQPVRLSTLIDGTRMRHAETIKRWKLSLNVHIRDDLPDVYGDDQYLTIMLDQLVDNAIRYTPEGGTVTIASTCQGDYAVLEVGDDGIGIDEQTLPHVFKRFFRLNDAHSTRGFGLGLTIAHKIVERHNGLIDIQSQLDVGTTVRVLLPFHHLQKGSVSKFAG